MTPSPDASPAVTTFALPAGRRFTVRPVRPDDAAGLAALYDALCDEDRYRRFFSLYRPPGSVVEGWARSEPDRLRLVAVVSGPDGGNGDGNGGNSSSNSDDGGDSRIVGDACYVLLPDGDAEFAVTVASDWRGWLGPYLLDALASAAADRGIRNLQADILTENRRMLAVVKARGFVVLDHPDWTEVRLAIGTRPRIPGWPTGDSRPRLLVEGTGARWRGETEARAAGFRTHLCPGPQAGTSPRCPAIGGEQCPLAAEADVIVFALRPGDPRACNLLAAHPRLHRGVPLCVDVAPDGLEALSLPAGAVRVERSEPPAAVVSTLRALAGVAPGGAS